MTVQSSISTGQPAAPRPTFFTYGPFQSQFLSLLGATFERAADIGECFATAALIPDGDYHAWLREWQSLGDRITGIAEAAAADGHRVSAQEAYLRASNYYGKAAFFADGTNDPGQKLPLWEKHRTAFDSFAAHLDIPGEQISIPYEDTRLEGFIFKASADAAPRPWIIFNNGSDGTLATMWVNCIAAALRRGYNALTFDGPGQNAALFRQKLYLRPDWEKVVTPVVDFLLAREDVDAKRIALYGISQAGYWVPRAVAFEHRIAAAIVDPGVFSVLDAWTANVPPDAIEALFNTSGEDLEEVKQGLDQGIDAAKAGSKPFAFTLDSRVFPYGTTSFSEALLKLRDYDLAPVVHQITCPIAISAPEGETYFARGSQQLFDAITGPKTLISFTAAEGADLHCEPTAAGLRAQRLLDWLDDTLIG